MSRQRPQGAALTPDELRDVRLWFGWGSVLGYPTGPRDYLREALQPKFRAEFLAIPRPKRKAILRFVIDEHALRETDTQGDLFARLEQHTWESLNA